MTFQDLSNNYSIKWSTSVNDITLSDWEDIFGKSIIKSQRFFISIEKSDFQQITIYYLQIFEPVSYTHLDVYKRQDLI